MDPFCCEKSTKMFWTSAKNHVQIACIVYPIRSQCTVSVPSENIGKP